MEWKRKFLTEKYEEEKSLRVKEYEEEKIWKDEEHTMKMKLMKLKQVKLMRDLGIKNESEVVEIDSEILND